MPLDVVDCATADGGSWRVFGEDSRAQPAVHNMQQPVREPSVGGLWPIGICAGGVAVVRCPYFHLYGCAESPRLHVSDEQQPVRLAFAAAGFRFLQ
eukprot:CAMPEP_0183596960 /NCGR_PEP_ID=MMETSP0371-20130417/176051_1 /TAXON_ID=268820 /ORGANISM="Peridinium aciculiferum, Strain PAER-2" /LENGTH=95 /DNA_ID=CAMNT_0025808875 /DNA_START=22 /DNA_END=309 /DNA_ORIENTATION=+